MNLNLKNIVLFYLAKLYQTGESMTLAELQADIAEINSLMTEISNVFDLPINNQVVTFLQAADQDPLLQDIMLLVLNQLNPTPAPSVEPKPEPILKV